jgi:hypothetical protein
MTIDEFRILTKAMKAVYTSPTFLPDAYAVKLWYQMLKDIPYEQATAAIHEYMLTNKFPPTIADIREMATVSEVQDWGTGWQKTLSVIRKYGWCRQKEALEELDELTRQTVQRLGYMELCTSDNLMADRGNFRMIYEELSAKEKTREKLPEKLRKELSNESRGITGPAKRQASDKERD